MSSDPAGSATASGSCAFEVDMRVIGFSAPEIRIRSHLIAVDKREIRFTMENVSTRQGEESGS